MKRNKTIKGDELVFTNVLLDGSQPENLDGYVIPYNDHTAAAYRIMVDIKQRLAK